MPRGDSRLATMGQHGAAPEPKTKCLTPVGQSETIVNMERETRDQVIGVRFTPSEVRELERLAAREQMTSSSFVRSATLSYLALTGNRVAWRSLGESARRLLGLIREPKQNLLDQFAIEKGFGQQQAK